MPTVRFSHPLLLISFKSLPAMAGKFFRGYGIIFEDWSDMHGGALACYMVGVVAVKIFMVILFFTLSYIAIHKNAIK